MHKKMSLSSLSLLATSFLLAVLVTRPALAGELTWARHAEAQRGEATSFSCGALGHYSISATVGGREVASGVTGSFEKKSPSGSAPIATGTESPQALGGLPLAPPGPTPCDDGSCFDPEPRSGLWVAVVDWGQQWHGEAVAWLIDQIAGSEYEVVLFPLDGGITSSLYPSATDLQVLEQLCLVLEEAEAGHPPAAVNMSFGRPADEVPCGSSGPTLGCEIGQVLDALHGEGVWLVAAAGNHRTPLFPGTHPRVMSVGALDIETFRSSDQLEPAWQSPVADALMPATALCLPEGAGTWGPPPGSSFAAAVMTSWLIGSRLTLESPSIGGWGPLEHFENGERRYLLQNAHGHFPGTSVGMIDTLISGVITGEGGGCHPLNFFTQPTSVSVVPRSTAPLALPIVDYTPSANGPTPDPDPCLPCTGGWDDAPGGGGLTGRLGAVDKIGGPGGLAVSFMDSPGVPPSLELVDVLLVRSRGDLYFEMDLPAAEHAQLIEDIAAGTVDAMVFQGLSGHLLSGDSVSVVYLFEPVTEEVGGESRLTTEKISPEPSAGPTRYWSSTPIYEITLHWPT